MSIPYADILAEAEITKRHLEDRIEAEKQLRPRGHLLKARSKICEVISALTMARLTKEDEG
jgi:hypothetical protein